MSDLIERALREADGLALAGEPYAAQVIRELEAELTALKSATVLVEQVAKARLERAENAEAERDAKTEALGKLAGKVVGLEVVIRELKTGNEHVAKNTASQLRAIEAATIKRCKQAIVKARFGPPSHWGGNRPNGWHLDRPCTPHEAAMHDNGCNDAFAAVSALTQSSPSVPSPNQPPPAALDPAAAAVKAPPAAIHKDEGR